MVKYVKCNGEKLPISISFYALEKLEIETGKGMTELVTEISNARFSLYTPLFFYSLEAGFHAEKKIFDIKREDIPFMLDECWLEFTALMGEFFTQVGTANEKKVKK